MRLEENIWGVVIGFLFNKKSCMYVQHSVLNARIISSKDGRSGGAFGA